MNELCIDLWNSCVFSVSSKCWKWILAHGVVKWGLVCFDLVGGTVYNVCLRKKSSLLA